MIETKFDTFILSIGLASINLTVLIQNLQGFFVFLTVVITFVIALIKLKELLKDINKKSKKSE